MSATCAISEERIKRPKLVCVMSEIAAVARSPPRKTLETGQRSARELVAERGEKCRIEIKTYRYVYNVNGTRKN
ncbi:hypothetical protein NDU88_002918 [Pleurodeles waltl]|uniref:Uncharacterized protein n=1 Tax=Pleurodeles waltl TaxID=8319 RepID=A0AAV7MT23_PLEWA|nr:hypothetical protein NDU88_002918 [Pleurodeles waltl]